MNIYVYKEFYVRTSSAVYDIDNVQDLFIHLTNYAVQVAFACCSVLQCVAGCCRVLQGVVVYRSALQCVALCCSVLQCQAQMLFIHPNTYDVLQCIALCYD